MSDRDWLIVAGVIVLVLIILDGVRRMRKRNKLRLDIDSKFQDLPEEDFGGELPNGGARRATVQSDAQSGEAVSSGRVSNSAGSTSEVTADDVDLLLAGDFRGVGDGAEEWLQPQSLGAATKAKTSNRNHSLSQLASSYENTTMDAAPSMEEEDGYSLQEEQLRDSFGGHERREPSLDDIDLLEPVVDASNNESRESLELRGKITDKNVAKDDVKGAGKNIDAGIDDGIIGAVRVRKASPEELSHSRRGSDDGQVAAIRSEAAGLDESRMTDELETESFSSHQLPDYGLQSDSNRSRDYQESADREDPSAYQDYVEKHPAYDHNESLDAQEQVRSQTQEPLQTAENPEFAPEGIATPESYAIDKSAEYDSRNSFDAERIDEEAITAPIPEFPSQGYESTEHRVDRNPGDVRTDDPQVSLIEDPVLDLNRPITDLMNDMSALQASIDEHGGRSEKASVSRSMTSVSKPSVSEPSVSEPPISKPTISEDITADAGLSLKAGRDELEMDAVAAELGALAATDPEPKAKTRARTPTRKTRKAVRQENDKPVKKSRMRRLREEIQTSFFDLDPELAPEPVEDGITEAPKAPEKQAKEKPKSRRKSKAKSESSSSADTSGRAANPSRPTESDVSQATKEEAPREMDPEALLVINVAGRTVFQGKALFRVLEACAMEFGDMNIFHRYEDGPHQGAVQFRMANAIKPGYFEPEAGGEFETPAVTFFMDMSEPREVMNAFECMLATAQCVADNLDGVLKDENRSVMRPQTIEHYRQQIRDHERRKLAKRAG